MSVTLKDVGSGFKRTAINENFTDIETEINNNLLNKDGSTALEADLDFNSQRAINIAAGIENSDAVNLSQLNGAISAASSGLIISQVESQLGSAAVARVFTFSGITYTVGANNLEVYRNGQRLENGVDYSETSSSSITLTFDPNGTDRFVFRTNTATTNSVSTTAAITHTEDGTDYNLATYLSNREASTVAELKTFSPEVGEMIVTKGYYSAGDGGHATYLVASPQAVDGYGNHLAANGNALLLQSEEYVVEQWGAVGDYDGVSGTDNFDTFKAIIADINAKGSGVVVYASGKNYLIDRHIENGNVTGGGGDRTVFNLDGCEGLVFKGNGATVTYEGNWTRDNSNTLNSGLPGFKIFRSRNIRIENLTLDGGSQTVTPDTGLGNVEPSDWTGIWLVNCEDARIDNCYVHSFGRDIFTFQSSTVAFWQTPGHDFYNCNNILVSNCRAERGGRQGFSNIGARNVTFENCSLNFTGTGLYGGHSPGYAIDIEPNNWIAAGDNVDSEVENILFINCELNKGGLNAIAANLVDRCRRVSYINCSMYNNTTGSLGFFCGAEALVVKDCTINMDGGNFYLSFDNTLAGRPGDTTIEGCEFRFTDVNGVARLTDNSGFHRYNIRNCLFKIDNSVSKSYSISLFQGAEGSSFENNRVEITAASHTGSGLNTPLYLRGILVKGNTYYSPLDGSGGAYFLNDYQNDGNVLDEDFSENVLNGYRARPANWPIGRLYTRANSQIAGGQYHYTDNSDSVATHKLTNGIPTSGEAKQGDIFWNRNVVAGGKVGWVCTTSGSIGSTAVLKEFGVIDP